MRTKRVLGVAVLATLLPMAALGALAVPAASPQGGARYVGSTSQGEQVMLHVSRDSRAVRSLQAGIIAICAGGRPDRGVYELAGIAIRGSAFDGRQRLGSPSGGRGVLSVVGRFGRGGGARGRLRLVLRRAADEERAATTCRARVSFVAQIPRSARTRFGALKQLGGPGACFSLPARRGCARERLFDRARDLAVSPDGQHVYVVVWGPHDVDEFGDHLRSSILAYVRNPTTGRLRRAPDATGCIREKGGDGCASARALRNADSIQVSDDGRHVYAASGEAVAVFGRDPTTGALSQAPGPEGCVTVGGRAGCGVIRAFEDNFFFSSHSFALGPHGRYAYLLGDRSIIVFLRDRATGRLTQPPGEAGCVTPDGSEGCSPARRIGAPSAVVVSPDGRHVYLGSLLRPPEIELFRRERGSKALRGSTDPGGCISYRGVKGCARLRGATYVQPGAVSPDGRHLYMTASDDGLVAFSRRPHTGALRQLSGLAGCVLEAPGEGCGSGRAIEGLQGPLVSPDGRNVYVSGHFSLVAFARNRSTGQLRQLPGKSGCLADSLSSDRGSCASPVQHFWGTRELAVSPDGRHVYAVGNGLLTVYARRGHR